MNAAGKIAAFTVALAAAFGGAYAVGGVLDPISAEPEKVHEQHEEPASEKDGKSEKSEDGKSGDAEKGDGGEMDHGEMDHENMDHG